MPNLTELELENLRHIIGGHATMHRSSIKANTATRCASGKKYKTTINVFFRIGGNDR